MKKRTIVVRDPDFGPIELPVEELSEAQWNLTRERIRARLMKSVLWKPGRIYECPECHRRAFAAAQDLVQEVRRADKVVILKNLHGARCSQCGFRVLDGREELRIDDEYERMSASRHEAAVSRVGRGTLGTYWPKAVERSLELKPGTRLEVDVLAPDSAMIRVVRRPGHNRKPRRQCSKPGSS